MATKNAKNIIRQNNLLLVQQQFFQAGKLFASDLVKKTGISMVTIQSLLKELLEKQIIFEGEIIQREMGRPAVAYHFNYEKEQNLLLCIREKQGQLIIESLVTNLAGKIAAKEIIDFSQISLPRFLEITQQQLQANPQVQQIGIFFPGKVANDVVQSSWFEKFNGWHFQAEIQKIANIPVFVQNDAHLLTIGYCLAEKLSLQETYVGLYYPLKSMPGITLFAHNQLIEGNLALAGEAKFLPGFINQLLPQTGQALATRLAEIIPFYNAAIAPKCFIITSPVAESLLLKEITENQILAQQPNRPLIAFVSDFQRCMILGLHWLIYRDTPYDLAEVGYLESVES
ncbi:hypothetical protein M2139_000607 [Enterococcus sp. PF1-24]|uniref:ROK family protein n=1 Tax=unclassified Enterococcus TaxID=2608891 RepID=UPI00247442FA|nr:MULTISPECIES: ROK family protein [unclassified Enterococcus]MDH6363770.1 hypothetical protein [Enterococcus sp. PFB1-1]MDH6400726.1 hypothetical protein [Enterococcus sp. PF1-24]